MHNYHLYGRKTYPEPLQFVADLEAESGTEAVEAASERVAAHEWLELILIPAAATIRVLPEEQPQ